jgi:hypothetical protein
LHITFALLRGLADAAIPTRLAGAQLPSANSNKGFRMPLRIVENLRSKNGDRVIKSDSADARPLCIALLMQMVEDYLNDVTKTVDELRTDIVRIQQPGEEVPITLPCANRLISFATASRRCTAIT